LSVFEAHLSVFLERLCLTASAGYGRAECLSAFQEILREFEAHLSVFLERLCLTASAGYGRAERLSAFQEILPEFEAHLSVFLERLCLTASAGYGRAERLQEFFGVLSPFLATLSLFLASRHDEGDPVPEVAPTLAGHRADPGRVHPTGDEPVEHLLRLPCGRPIDPRLTQPRVLPLVARPVAGCFRDDDHRT
jgi:hypothetical protein